eukprot:TRINITY_DN113355_c0_g1_i1.p1 TRINITY_DN113355_c0_g1~~TRINITY_DN113355_c0_g1_i1.p1  ORF type:complete len:305 (-),score=39.79 TRINITY_DN113355_c0_g1_i1:89-916(-)
MSMPGSSFAAEKSTSSEESSAGVGTSTPYDCVGTAIAALGFPEQLHHVGRLDEHSCGLLLLTNDGRVTKKLIAEGNNIPREYCCVVKARTRREGPPEFEKLKRQLEEGVNTRYGIFFGKLISLKTPFRGTFEHEKCCSTSKSSKNGHCDSSSLTVGLSGRRNDGPDDFDDDVDVEGSDSDHHQLIDDADSFGENGADDADGVQINQECFDADTFSEVVVQIMEGKKREVRRMLAHCGHVVLNLRRLSYGAFKLGDLQPGATRRATPEELKWVMDI